MSTPDEISYAQEFIKLLPVLVGGLLAILGGAGSQYLIHRLGTERERRKLLRERGEAFIKALHAHSDWLQEKTNAMVFENKDHDRPSPLDEAQMIQQLYFPQLAKPIYDVMAATKPIVEWVYQQRISRLQDQAAWWKAFDRKPYNTMFEAYLKAQLGAVSDAVQEVREHIES